MKKIINYLKGLIRKFTSRPKACERYILNNRYREDAELIMPSTAYKDIIDDIENEIKCGGFNKEYLKQ